MKKGISSKKVALIEPAIEELSTQAGNKYILCNVVARRAKEIMKEKNDPSYSQKDSDIKEITEAANELIEKKLVVEELPDTVSEDDE